MPDGLPISAGRHKDSTQEQPSLGVARGLAHGESKLGHRLLPAPRARQGEREASPEVDARGERGNGRAVRGDGRASVAAVHLAAARVQA